MLVILLIFAHLLINSIRYMKSFKRAKRMVLPFLTNSSGDLITSTILTAGVDFNFPIDAEFNVVSAPAATSSTPTAGLAFECEAQIVQNDCGLSNLSGCFKNALVWAFCPNAALLGNISGTGSAIRSLPPLGYFFVNIDALRGLSASGPPATSTAVFSTVASSGFGSDLFHPLDVGMASIVGLSVVISILFLLFRVTI